MRIRSVSPTAALALAAWAPLLAFVPLAACGNSSTSARDEDGGRPSGSSDANGAPEAARPSADAGGVADGASVPTDAARDDASFDGAPVIGDTCAYLNDDATHVVSTRIASDGTRFGVAVYDQSSKLAVFGVGSDGVTTSIASSLDPNATRLVDVVFDGAAFQVLWITAPDASHHAFAAQRFDPTTLTPVGPPVTSAPVADLLEGIAAPEAGGALLFETVGLSTATSQVLEVKGGGWSAASTALPNAASSARGAVASSAGGALVLYAAGGGGGGDASPAVVRIGATGVAPAAPAILFPSGAGKLYPSATSALLSIAATSTGALALYEVMLASGIAPEIHARPVDGDGIPTGNDVALDPVYAGAAGLGGGPVATWLLYWTGALPAAIRMTAGGAPTGASSTFGVVSEASSTGLEVGVASSGASLFAWQRRHHVDGGGGWDATRIGLRLVHAAGAIDVCP